ncbi:MAG TPA: hypothetical protein VHN99_04570, partial [Deinococcales bacterium]|nr:hypothetical protein [Deinococcales bacterium]
SHQLTPVALAAALVALAVAGWRGAGLAALALVALAAAWDATFAATFMTAHNDWYTSLGTLFDNLHFSTSSGGIGSPAHQEIARITRTFTLGTWLLAALGVFRAARRGAWSPGAVALALAPFTLIALGNYGGEVLLRVAFFATPFMALLAAGAVFPHTDHRTSRPALAAAFLLGPALYAGFLFAAYGNEVSNEISRPEVDAARHLYATMPAGAMLVTTSLNNFPLNIAGNYDRFELVALAQEPLTGPPALLGPDDAEGIQARLAREKRPEADVVFFTGQEWYVKRYGLFQPGSLNRLRAAVARLPGARLTYRNPEVSVYRIPNPGAGARP